MAGSRSHLNWGGSRNHENHRDFIESTISQTGLEIAPLSHPVISAKSSSTRHEFTQDFSKISPTARARSPTAVHGTWLEENSPPAGERAPRITPDSFSGSAGCAPGSPAPASAASRRLARSHAGRSTASGAWEAAALPCAARSSRSLTWLRCNQRASRRPCACTYSAACSATPCACPR